MGNAIELGLADPVDQITITDWTTVIDMVQGKANPLATEVVTADSTLKEALEKAKNKWHFTAVALGKTPKKERNAWLRHKARAHRIAQTYRTHFSPWGSPVWQDSSLSHEHIALLAQYRCLRAQGRLQQIKHCVLCHQTNIRQNTVGHYLSHCTYGAEVAEDPERQRDLTEADQATWVGLDEEGISDLCARPKHREPLLTLALDTLKHCLMFDTEANNIAN